MTNRPLYQPPAEFLIFDQKTVSIKGGLTKILWAIIALHLLVLVAASVPFFLKPYPQKKQSKIVVQTIQLKQKKTPPATKVVASGARAPVKQIPKPKPTPVSPKPQPKKTLSKPIEKPMKRRLAPQKALAEAAQKLSQNQSQKELFKATKQEKIEAISSEKINLVASSSQIAAFSNWSAKESDYNDLVEEILRAHLVLPEKGTVKLNLKIKESGQIVSYSIKSSSSDKNSQYIDENLARINFPTFDKTKTKRSVLELNINLSGKT